MVQVSFASSAKCHHHDATCTSGAGEHVEEVGRGEERSSKSGDAWCRMRNNLVWVVWVAYPMTGVTWRGYCSEAISGQTNCLVRKGLKSE